MRLVRALDPASGEVVWAVVQGEHLAVLHDPLPRLMEKLETSEPLTLGHPFVVGDGAYDVPATPTKVVCVGLNYLHHAEEQGKAVPEEPLIFMKPVSALLPNEGTIVLPEQSQLVHHEGELAIVIGRRCRNVSVDDAENYILGYTCANDVSARDIQRREKRYTRAKGFDTFCPLGPVLVTRDEFFPSEHRVKLEVNGEVRQDSSLDDFIFPIPEIIAFISRVMTLEPGDVILTGTPAGVGPIEDGDTVTVTIDGLGKLTNHVAR